jgi:pimeloyl-ACP methyl ester carboxylesterase
MAVLIEGAGVPLSVEQRGDGRAVLVVHDIASDAAGSAVLAEELSAHARAIAYDRRGYGASGAPEPYEATTVHEQAEDAACVLRSVGAGDAVVVGLGFGALIALDLLERHRDVAGAAVLADPPLFAFVPEAAEALAGKRVLLEEALREGGPELAVERWLGEGAPADRVARARAAHRAFFADLAGIATWPVTRGRLRAVTAPAVVLTSPDAAPHVARAADAVAELLPQARRERDGDVSAAALSLL